MATSPSPNPPPSAIPQFTTTAPPPLVFYLPAHLPYFPELNANSPAAAPAKSPQNPLSANSTANTPVSPPEHPITSTPPQLSITSPPPEFSITSPPPPQLADVPTLPEISPPPLSANPLPSSATPPKPTLPTTSPLPPSTPFVASPPPLSPASPKSSPIPTVRRPSAVSPRSTPTPTVTPPSPVSSKSTPPSPKPSPKPPTTRPPTPSKASTNSPPAPSPPPERSSPPTPVKKPHPASPNTRISSNISLKVSPPPSPFFSLRVSPPPSVNLTTNNPSSLKSTENAGIGTGGTVVIVLVLGLVLISLIGITICCMRKRRRKFSGMNDDHIILTSLSFSPKSDSALLKMQTLGTRSGSNMGSDTVYSPPTESGGLGNSRSWFTYEELADATKGFSMQNLLGEGGFGFVYKGYLGDGREIAVKQLNVGGGQGEREFKAEVEIISRVHHRHLVSLVGYCVFQNQRLLVYDYVANNNLYFHLHEESRPVMEWTKRVKVAAGAARGIAYLHEDCHPRIIHRDIKSSNILLDNSFEARVSDFGLAKLVLNANSHVTTRVIGTFGYMAPEYAASGLLTEKSDVYSFGVVLLELITGRKPVDASQPAGDESLVEWARPLLTVALDNGNIKALADPGLGNNYVECEMFKIVEVAAACVRHAAAKRPRMGQVVREFDSMAASDITNGMRVGESELFNSLQSAEIRFFSRVQIASQDCSKKIF